MLTLHTLYGKINACSAHYLRGKANACTATI